MMHSHRNCNESQDRIQEILRLRFEIALLKFDLLGVTSRCPESREIHQKILNLLDQINHLEKWY